MALLLEKNPEFTPQEIKSKLITTSNLVTDPFGNEFPMNIGGAGRVNVTNAFNSELLILPSNLRFDLSTEKNSQVKNLHLNLDNLDNQLEIEFSDFVNVNFDYNLQDNIIQVTSQLTSNETGEFEGRLFILHNGITHQIPIHVRVSDDAVNIIVENDELIFEILKPLEWTYAKISAVNKETLEKDSISFSSKNNTPLKIYKSGDYWIEAKISTDKNIFDVYDSIKINLLSENEKSVFYYLEEIERPVLILSIITVLVGIFGIRILRN